MRKRFFRIECWRTFQGLTDRIVYVGPVCFYWHHNQDLRMRELTISHMRKPYA